MKFDESEANDTAEALANVGKHYNVPVSPVMQAWIALGATVGGICAGKAAAIKVQRQMTPEAGETSPNISRVLRPVEAAE